MLNMRTSYRQYHMSHIWKWMIFGLLTLTCVNATVVCEDCRPLDLQEGPGIGLSVAPSYGAASVRFANGTTSDVAIIQGGEDYLQAMIRWQQLGGSAVNTATQPPQVEDPATDAEASTPSSYWQILRAYAGQVSQVILGEHRSTARASDDLDDDLKPIADMMAALFRITKEFVPLKYDKVFLAVPDFVTTPHSPLNRPIEPLLREAGLESFGDWTQSRAALLGLYDLENCFGVWVDLLTEVPDKECELYNGRSIQSVLFVAVDGTSLALRSLIRDDGMFYPDLGATEVLWKNNKTDDDGAYFAWVDQQLRKFLNAQDTAFDLLLLSGTNATAPQLQDIIKEVLKDNAKIRPKDFLRSEKDHAFAAARGVARVARHGMCSDFNACLPNSWCPISKYCDNWAWHNKDADDGKSEL